jgi:hypothetical protein
MYSPAAPERRLKGVSAPEPVPSEHERRGVAGECVLNVLMELEKSV